MKMRPFLLSAVLASAVLAVLASLAPAPLHAQGGAALSGRPMHVEDLFTIESFTDVALSPDGEWLAVVISRAATEKETYNRPYLWGNERADVWLVSPDGSVRRNLTNGAADGSGYWNPVWSPDGRRLAMLSTRGGDNVRLYVWERGTDKVRAVSQRPIDLDATVYDGKVVSREGQLFTWLSATELLFAALPDTMRSRPFDVLARTPRIATQAWRETARGRTAQVSVLDSPVGVGDTVVNRTAPLVRVDLARSAPDARPAGRVITRLSLEGSRRTVVVSPRKDRAAVTEGVFPHPPPPEEQLRSVREARLGMVTLEESSPVWWVDSVPRAPSGLAWSADGTALAVVGTPSSATQNAHPRPSTAMATSGGALYLVSPGTRSVRRATGSGMSVMGMEWAGADLPLVYATATEDSSRVPGWWAMPRVDDPQLLTRRIAGVSPNLVRVGAGLPSGDQLLAVGAGDLWSIHPASSTAPTNLTASFEPRIASVVWPQAPVERHSDPEVIVETEGGPDGKLYRLRLSREAVEAALIEQPVKEARLQAYRPSQRLALFGTFHIRAGAADPTTSDGPTLWATNPDGGDPRTLIDLNPHLDEIIEPETRFIHYRGLDGDSLIASATLPVGYQEGMRYPVVTFVYAGSVIRDTTRPKRLLRKNNPSALNLQLLAAQGYVVLIPSMPLPRPPARSDAYMELMKGVLPAVDKLIDLGIAAPDRLGVMGQSFGGFATYGLITQTDRFGAAVALAGPVDWISMYGIFDPRARYTSAPQQFGVPSIIESFQPSLGASPWEDLWAYLRNSPLYYLDRVETPLLIIQGDLDYIPMAQGEMAFTAMLRMGKRARFVRYWGEGHVLNSPANVKHMWEQIFGWLDKYVKSEQHASREASREEAVGHSTGGSRH